MEQKPKVLMFGWELPPYNTGGLGVACYGMAKGLSLQGVPIAFALPKQLNVNVPFMQVLSHDLQGVEITAINSLLEAYTNETHYTQTVINSQNPPHIYGSTLYEETLRFGQMGASWSRNQPYDLIHTHDWLTYPAGIEAKKISGKPLVAHIHATEYDRTGGNINTQIADIEYQGLNAADQVIAVSHYTKNIVNKQYGVPLEKIHVVHNGVDLVDFQPHEIKRIFPNKKIVLFVGRLTFQKGVDYFLQSAKEVIKTNPDTIFLIVGYGDMYQELIMKAALLGIADKVIFTGFLQGEKLRACYQMADAFVMPSVSEPYGIVALEALAAQTPAIISKQSGVSESVNHTFKVDFWDTKKMAEMISTVLTYPKLADKMAYKALRETQKLTWEKTAERIIKVYDKTLQ